MKYNVYVSYLQHGHQSFEEDERTLTMIDPLYGDSLVSSQSNEDVHIVDEEAGPQPEQPTVEGSKSVEENKAEIVKKARRSVFSVN